MIKRINVKTSKNSSISSFGDISTRAYSTPYRIKKIKWIFHEFDSDPNPSVPHGHNYEKHYKLDIITGDVYNQRNNTIIGTVKSKELKRLKEDDTFKVFAAKSIKWYLETYPNIKIRYPEWIDLSSSNESTEQCFSTHYAISKESYSMKLTTIIKPSRFQAGIVPKRRALHYGRKKV